MRHLGRWGPKQGITCFRLYERDIPDFPLIVDWFADLDAQDPTSEGDAVVWAFPRTRDRGDPTAEREYLERVRLEVGQGLNISEDRVHLRARGRQRDGSGQRQQYVRMEHKNQCKVVQEYGVRFEINLSDYLDVGLFLDHRVLRREISERIADRSLLNLFAYTGAFSVHARVGGAGRTTTVDLSKTYLEWYQRNCELNALAEDDCHIWIQDDCLQFLEDGPQPGELYDTIVLDPPTFSNSKRMRDTFSVGRDHAYLIECASRFMATDGELFFSTNDRGFELDAERLPRQLEWKEISNRTVPEDFRNRKVHRAWRFREAR